MYNLTTLIVDFYSLNVQIIVWTEKHQARGINQITNSVIFFTTNLDGTTT